MEGPAKTPEAKRAKHHNFTRKKNDSEGAGGRKDVKKSKPTHSSTDNFKCEKGTPATPKSARLWGSKLGS